MATESVGYLDFDGRMTRLATAMCCFTDGQLHLEAEGSKCKLRLLGVRFPEVKCIADLSKQVFGPDSESVHDDPIAEGGIEARGMWLSFQSLEVKCRAYGPEARLITVSFAGEVQDYESGRRGPVDCSVRCHIVDTLW